MLHFNPCSSFLLNSFSCSGSSPPPLSPSYGNRKPKRSPFSKFLDLLEEPPKLTIEQQIQKRKDKIGRQNWPVLTWIFTLGNYRVTERSMERGAD
jgi:hypothetical protein